MARVMPASHAAGWPPLTLPFADIGGEHHGQGTSLVGEQIIVKATSPVHGDPTEPDFGGIAGRCAERQSSEPRHLEVLR
ncbi:hypothetical protein EB231_14445 [Mesorhizobium sp. NZP2298]|nr:hypothetical protein EB231_14445 [Mesorhizobium sp. NZP2298]